MNVCTAKWHHIVRTRHRCSIRLREQSPCVIESAALDERAQGENGLPAARPPSHAGALEPLGDQGLACRLDDAGADGQALGLGIGVAHAVAIATEVAQHLCDSLVARRLRAQIEQRPNDAVDPISLMAQQMAILLELRRGCGGVGPVGGVEGVFEMLDGVVEVDELDPVGQGAGEECPVVLRPVGDCCRSHYFVGDFSVYSWSTEARFVTLTRHRRRAEPERFGWRGKAARQ